MSSWREEKENFYDIEELYAVIRITGGSIYEKLYSVVQDNLSRNDAIEMADHYRKMIPPGQDRYYRITYKAIPMSKIDSSLCYGY